MHEWKGFKERIDILMYYMSVSIEPLLYCSYLALLLYYIQAMFISSMSIWMLSPSFLKAVKPHILK